MRYERVRMAAMSQIWAIQPEKLEAILDVLDGHLATGNILAAIEAAAIEARQKASELRAMSGSVAVLPLYGVISHRASMVGGSGPGGVSTAQFTQQLNQAVADPSVKAIVIDCDSPGGTIDGVQEAHDEVMKARAKKSVTAVADCTMASAALWICSAANQIVASPSSQVGSIGIISQHEDKTAQLEAQGVKKTYTYAGKYKAEGAGALDEEAQSNLQAKVDHYYGMFLNSVGAGRGITAATVERKFGQGRMLTAQDALAAGLVDRIGTLDSVLAKLGANSSSPRASMAAMEARLKLASL